MSQSLKLPEYFPQHNYVSYCINPRCPNRENLDQRVECQACGTPQLVNGRFRLLRPLRPLDADNYTEIFEVEDRGTRKVMKVLRSRDPKRIELLQREAYVMSIVNHPGIPLCDPDECFTFTSAESSLELHCIVMEKIEGQNLDQWIEAHGRISQELALNWLVQLVGILDEVHRSGFFHRDIKPSNIILRPDGQLALIDFGAVREVTDTYLAKISGSGGTSTGLGGEYEITVFRTAFYTPQEQINGQAVPQSDFYALGRTFIFLTTDISLRRLPTDQETGTLIWRDKASQIQKPLADFIDELQAPAPGRRPQSTRVILEYLNHRLPLLLKLDRTFNSLPFRVGMLVLVGLGLIGLFRGLPLFMSRYYFSQGAEAQLNGDLEVARREYEQSIQFNSGNTDAYNNLGIVCGELGDPRCAIESYQKIFEQDPEDWAAHYNMGNFYDEREQYKQAEEEYRLAQKADNNLAVDATNNLSRLKNLQGDYQAAAALAQQGLTQTDDPISQAALYKNLGWASFKQNRYIEAEKTLLQSSRLDSERADTYCLLAQVHEAQKETAAASLAWKRCLQLDSDLPEVRAWREKLVERVSE